MITNSKYVLCDDFTGAMEIGALSQNRGIKSRVVFEIDKNEKSNEELIIVDTESRNIFANDAYRKVEKISNEIREKNSIIYKKIDSTLRGNLSSELRGILNSKKVDCIFLTPTLPLNKRTVVNGLLYLDGKEITESDLAKDPFSPVKQSNIKDLLKDMKESTVVKIDEVRKGDAFLLNSIEQMYNRGIRIFILDSETNSDLDIIANTIDLANVNILPCGSSGLFRSVLKNISSKSTGKKMNIIRSESPVVVISGSPAVNTKEQIRYAKDKAVIVIKLDDIDNYKNIKKDIFYHLNCGENIIIDAAASSKEELLKKYGDDKETLKKQSFLINNKLSQIAKEVIEQFNLAGLICCGGDTTYSICKKLSVDEVVLRGELEPYVPIGEIKIDKSPFEIITKAGGFGSKEMLVKGIKYFRGEEKYE